jgi:hypothetical protein
MMLGSEEEIRLMIVHYHRLCCIAIHNQIKSSDPIVLNSFQILFWL